MQIVFLELSDGVDGFLRVLPDKRTYICLDAGNKGDTAILLDTVIRLIEVENTLSSADRSQSTVFYLNEDGLVSKCIGPEVGSPIWPVSFPQKPFVSPVEFCWN